MKKLYIVIGLTLFASAAAQTTTDDLFAGMQPLRGVEYETLADPTDVMSERIRVSIDELEPDGVGFRYYIAEGYEPSVLYEDVCPSGYETVWYTYEVLDANPVLIEFSPEVQKEQGEVFWPIFYGEQRTASGQESFTDPVYIGSCAYSEKSGVFYENQTAYVENTGLGPAVTARCQILVNNSGKQTIISDTEGLYSATCFGDQVVTASTQSEQWFYYPDGSPIETNANSINDVHAEFFPNIPSYTHIGSLEAVQGDVIFKLFTDEPLFFVTNQPEEIPEIIDSFDLQEFLNSWQLTNEIEAHIEDGLTDLFMLETLGPPNDKTTTSDGSTRIEQWYYEPYNLTLFFTNGSVSRYVEH